MTTYVVGDLVLISRSGTEEVSVEWQIRDFLSLPFHCDDYYSSSDFRFGNDDWWLSLYSDWESDAEHPDVWGLDLKRDDGGPPVTFHFSVGIRGSGGVEKSREGEAEILDDEGVCDWNKFFSRSELLEHRTRLMPDDTLIITCVLKRLGAARGCEKVHEDFARLLASGEYSDVTIQVGDVEFKVHRVVLFARSPTLSVSLHHESRERASNRIVIEDCEPAVFREFLHHIYTGSAQSLTRQNAFGLYRVADKYLADDLKQMCLEFIREALSVQTFCDTLKLALVHGESDLLQQATDFAARNIQSILISAEWQNFNGENPRQANEIIAKYFGPRS